MIASILPQLSIECTAYAGNYSVYILFWTGLEYFEEKADFWEENKNGGVRGGEWLHSVNIIFFIRSIIFV